ncbi:MAG: amidohydrolase [Proteobacteria bacterium]|nr:amidohydrolase [Pseudomonadota bacterium]
MIIDFSSHMITREVEQALSTKEDFGRIQKNFAPQSSDPEKRIEAMEKYGVDIQVLTQTTPVLAGLGAKEAAEVCRISNDAIGKICRSHPKKFVPFAVVSLLDVQEAVHELDRAVSEWGCRGVTIGTNHDNKGLDEPENTPFYEKVCEHDIPVFLHPMDWHSYNLVEEPAVMRLFGWPFDTTQAILRLVLSGTMERYPTLKIVTHHLGGGMFPFFSNRFNIKLENLTHNLKKPVSESFYRIYADTAVDGTAAALPCGHAFFGTERMLFGTDYPFSPENGEVYLRQNLAIIRDWDLPEEEKARILGGNALKLLKL